VARRLHYLKGMYPMMRARRWIHRAAWMALVVLGGCNAPSATGSLQAAQVIDNGIMLNGIMLNGIMLNGTVLNGIMLNGRWLAQFGEQLQSVDRKGATLAGAKLAPLDVGAGGLASSTSDGNALGGDGLIGAHLTGHTSWGRTITLRIDDAEADAAPNDDVILYQVSYTSGGHSVPLCGLDAGGKPVPAVAVGGRWNLGQGTSSGGDHIDDGSAFTFGCVEDAVGKCVRLGYKPWSSALAAHHQACTRMVRADYCGNGVSHTIDGTLIDVYDGLGIQDDTEGWFFEAEWNADGARCVNHQRVVALATVPECGARLISSRCGDLSHFDSGTLLMDEYKVQPTRRR
jgi:ADYC domain-containing protein